MRSALSLSLLAAACSANSANFPSPAGNNGYGGATSATFSAYCTGTLVNIWPLQAEGGGASWVGYGTLQAPAGTPFLVAAYQNQWAGYVIGGDGTPFELDTTSNNLVAGKDFTSSCAPATEPSTTLFVVLAATTLYPSPDYTGTPCTLAAGTELTNADFSAPLGTQGAQISATEIASKCGVSGTMYTKELPFGNLLPE